MILTVPMPSSLPQGVHVRPPRPEDGDALLELVRADEMAARGRTSITSAQVAEVLSPPVTTLTDDQWLAVDVSDRPLAWVLLWDHGDGIYQDVEAYRHPSLTEESLRALMLSQAVRRATQRARSAGLAEAFLLAGCPEGDGALEATLRCAGFEHQRVFHRMRMDLDDATLSSSVEPPDGVRVVPFDGSDSQWAAMHAVLTESFADHFGYAPTTLAAFRSTTSADPAPDRELWRLAYVDQHAVGALVASGRNAEVGGGYVRGLGVLPDHRGRGIASAMLREVLAAYRQRGRSWAGLAVDVDNTTGALGLYERVGLRTDEVVHAYSRRLLPQPRITAS